MQYPVGRQRRSIGPFYLLSILVLLPALLNPQHHVAAITTINSEVVSTEQQQPRQQPTQPTPQQQQQQSEKQQSQQQSNTKPNIIIILIDDMGFNDVSFHGSNQILTPNIDALAYNGIILNRHYVPNLCTPSRASLLTGKYPIHTGMQHSVIINDQPWGLPIGERLLPEILHDAGYATNLIGKWHLGFWRKELTPTLRGFDHHFGYYSGYIDYYNHTMHMLDRNYSAGLDFRRDLSPWPEADGLYATDVFTQEAERVIYQHDAAVKPLFLLMSHLAVHTGNENNPMQAPEEEVEKFSHISDVKRRTYAGMVSRLDDSVGRVIRALSNKAMLNNSIVLLYSDNGAPTVGIHSNAGSNHPFRGQKESPWEGGIRSAGLIWSPLLQQQSYVSNQVVHAIDWLPTLTSAAGIELPSKMKLDGVNLWRVLSENGAAQPRRLIHVLDDNVGYSAFTRGTLKYVNGTSFNGLYDGWLGDLPTAEQDPTALYYVQQVLSSEVHHVLGNEELSVEQVERLRAQATHECPNNEENYTQAVYRCEPLLEPCFFDIEKDPCERYNLAKLYPLQVQLLAQEVEQFRESAVESARRDYSDPRCDPALHGGVWEWWAETSAANGRCHMHMAFGLVTAAVNVICALVWRVAQFEF
ncbi:arylsulfatase B-like [Rhagoletis pomonella]|uniref:arylsulfatase B-like n=1 Tax=Rhagoletis pomonella TaxID=28610 RepID=UPI00177F4F1C|nr:arylsulfatase B-like [Rhagoletis pomonella]XP_036326648.1 arylsulfatase B-like [Rhagoletis pomonella]XP_036326649.1 arylsulfatase B-like [Rhagoletis pomonella]XP_036326650.1 arylsulfatase B-like [Rhagoletis pomonella]XP_036326652.1 arylsulfatase B-like [Rhagoletis pomonella]XP_036326653.1 arylsulfatase B-like [Rhagoletis pomonella]